MRKEILFIKCPKCGWNCSMKWQAAGTKIYYQNGTSKELDKETFWCQCNTCKYAFITDLQGEEIKGIY